MPRCSCWAPGKVLWAVLEGEGGEKLCQEFHMSKMVTQSSCSPSACTWGIQTFWTQVRPIKQVIMFYPVLFKKGFLKYKRRCPRPFGSFPVEVLWSVLWWVMCDSCLCCATRLYPYWYHTGAACVDTPEQSTATARLRAFSPIKWN